MSLRLGICSIVVSRIGDCCAIKLSNLSLSLPRSRCQVKTIIPIIGFTIEQVCGGQRKHKGNHSWSLFRRGEYHQICRFCSLKSLKAIAKHILSKRNTGTSMVPPLFHSKSPAISGWRWLGIAGSPMKVQGEASRRRGELPSDMSPSPCGIWAPTR